MTKKSTLATFIASIALICTIATSALAQYPPDISNYLEKDLYSSPIYAKAQDWVRCSIANYFPDTTIYAAFTIYYQDGTVVWPTTETVYDVAPWGVQYIERYQVQTEGAYWCHIKVLKVNDPKYVGWGSGDYSYEPAALGYEAVHVPASPAD
jgi:hypothetical protein